MHTRKDERIHVCVCVSVYRPGSQERRRKDARSGTRECSRCMHSTMYTGYTLPFRSRHYGFIPRENSGMQRLPAERKGMEQEGQWGVGRLNRATSICSKLVADSPLPRKIQLHFSTSARAHLRASFSQRAERNGTILPFKWICSWLNFIFEKYAACKTV